MEVLVSANFIKQIIGQKGSSIAGSSLCVLLHYYLVSMNFSLFLLFSFIVLLLEGGLTSDMSLCLGSGLTPTAFPVISPLLF